MLKPGGSLISLSRNSALLQPELIVRLSIIMTRKLDNPLIYMQFLLSGGFFLFVWPADFAGFQSAAWTAFIRHRALTGFAPVRQGRSAVANSTCRIRIFPAIAAFLPVHGIYLSQSLLSDLNIHSSVPFAPMIVIAPNIISSLESWTLVKVCFTRKRFHLFGNYQSAGR
jgi:hypothetical protein